MTKRWWQRLGPVEVMAIGITAVLVAWLLFDVWTTRRYVDEVAARRDNWFVAHNCKPKRYISGRVDPIMVYDCDGVEMVWNDMPEMP